MKEILSVHSTNLQTELRFYEAFFYLYNMSFEKDYNDLLIYARAVLSKIRISADPHDIVNEAFVIHHDSGEEYNRAKVLKIISRLCNAELDHLLAGLSKTKLPNDSCCKGCNELKPIGLFYIFTSYKNHNIPNVSTLCKECHKYSIRKKRIKKVRRPGKGINVLWREANKRYQAKQKENLTDVYIKGILKASGKPFTQSDIIKKRKELLQKRTIKIAA